MNNFILQKNECVVFICIVHTRGLPVHFMSCVVKFVNDACLIYGLYFTFLLQSGMEPVVQNLFTYCKLLLEFTQYLIYHLFPIYVLFEIYIVTSK